MVFSQHNPSYAMWGDDTRRDGGVTTIPALCQPVYYALPCGSSHLLLYPATQDADHYDPEREGQGGEVGHAHRGLLASSTRRRLSAGWTIPYPDQTLGFNPVLELVWTKPRGVKAPQIKTSRPARS